MFKMARRERIYNIVAVKWDRNPLHELAKLKSKELNISVREAQDLIVLQTELAKI